MGDPRRSDRVAEAIREQVATFLSDGVKDPRIRGFVTVTAVDMTRDLRHAKRFSRSIPRTATSISDASP